MKVGRYPNLKEEVGNSIHGHEIYHQLDGKTNQVANCILCFCGWFAGLLSQKEKKIKNKKSKYLNFKKGKPKFHYFHLSPPNLQAICGWHLKGGLKVGVSYSNNNLIQPPILGHKIIQYHPRTNTSYIILRIHTLACWLG